MMDIILPILVLAVPAALAWLRTRYRWRKWEPYVSAYARSIFDAVEWVGRHRQWSGPRKLIEYLQRLESWWRRSRIPLDWQDLEPLLKGWADDWAMERKNGAP